MADGRHVHADLMGPPALERQLQQRHRPLALPALPYRVPGAGRLARRGDRHFRRGAGRAADRRLHLAPFVGHGPRHQGQVAPLHGPGGQLVDQRPVGHLGPGHGQEARGPLVEAVHDPGPVGRAHPRRHEVRQVGETGQETADQRPLGVSGARMHHQPGRLVHHGHLVVGVDHLEGHARLRRHAAVVRPRHHDGQRGPSRSTAAPDRDRRAVHQHPPRGDQLAAAARETSATMATPRSTRTPARSGRGIVSPAPRPSPAGLDRRLATASSAWAAARIGRRRAGPR